MWMNLEEMLTGSLVTSFTHSMIPFVLMSVELQATVLSTGTVAEETLLSMTAINPETSKLAQGWGTIPRLGYFDPLHLTSMNCLFGTNVTNI